MFSKHVTLKKTLCFFLTFTVFITSVIFLDNKKVNATEKPPMVLGIAKRRVQTEFRRQPKL